MPELAEVEYYRRRWDPGLGGKVSRVLVHPAARIYREVPARAVVGGLSGRVLRESRARGKQMIFGFSGGAWLGLHLGMSGELRSMDPEEAPGKHDHLVLVMERVALVFADPRMFGSLRLSLEEGGDPPAWWRELPPAPLDPAFTKRRVAEFAGRFPRTPLKTLLLDQRGFPGIGNWMADEICWQMKAAPDRPVGSLDGADLGSLWRRTRRVSREAVRLIAPDWGDLPDSWLMNHRWRDGGRCPRCRSLLVRNELRGRTTCWCPACQVR